MAKVGQQDAANPFASKTTQISHENCSNVPHTFHTSNGFFFFEEPPSQFVNIEEKMEADAEEAANNAQKELEEANIGVEHANKSLGKQGGDGHQEQWNISGP